MIVVAIEVINGNNNPYLDIFIKDLELAGYSKYDGYDISKPANSIYMSIYLESKKYKIWPNSGLAHTMMSMGLRPIPIHWICHNFKELIINPMPDGVNTALSRIAYIEFCNKIVNNKRQ